MKPIEQMTDVEFLRWVAVIGQTTECEQALARKAVTDRLLAIANKINSAQVAG
jgi:hypothetical protein